MAMLLKANETTVVILFILLKNSIAFKMNPNFPIRD